MLRSLPRSVLLGILLALIALNIYVWKSVADSPLTIAPFQAGKGWGALVTTPTRETILIDFNTDAGVVREVGSRLPPWQRSITAVVGAHATGLSVLKSQYHVGRIETGPWRIDLGSTTIESMRNGIEVRTDARVFDLASSSAPIKI